MELLHADDLVLMAESKGIVNGKVEEVEKWDGSKGS